MKKIKILVVMMFLFSILGVINFSMADTYSATENSFTFIKNDRHYRLQSENSPKRFGAHTNGNAFSKCDACKEYADGGFANSTSKKGNATIEDAINKFYNLSI